MANTNEIYFTVQFMACIVIFIIKFYSVLMGGKLWDSKDDFKNLKINLLLLAIYLLLSFWGFSMWLIDITNKTLEVSLTFQGVVGGIVTLLTIIECVLFAESYTKNLNNRMGSGRE